MVLQKLKMIKFIFFNKNKHKHRIKFTIAHELGHIMLNNHFNNISIPLITKFGIDEQKRDRSKYVCKTFACSTKFNRKS